MKRMLLMVVVAVYVLFVSLKYDSIQLIANDSPKSQIELIDWGDDQFFQDKEFSFETCIYKSIRLNVLPLKKGHYLRPDFFYNKIYKEIKLTITTPPPRIG